MLVEVYLLSCRPDGLLAYRFTSGQLGPAETPDEAATRIGRLAAGRASTVVTGTVAVHSTSWRHLGDGSIVLAYAVAPDPVPDATAVPIRSFEVPHAPARTGRLPGSSSVTRSRRTRCGTWPCWPAPTRISTRRSPDARR